MSEQGETTGEDRSFSVYIIEHVSENDPRFGHAPTVGGEIWDCLRCRHWGNRNSDVVSLGDAGLLRLPRVIAANLTEAEAYALDCELPRAGSRNPIMSNDALDASRTAGVGRVETWRGGVRSSMSVSGP